MAATAYIDESLRASHGLYVIAAVVVSPAEAATATAALVECFRLPGRVHFHWRSEARERREAMARLIVELDLELHAYLCADAPGRHTARARALCLEELLWDHYARDTTRVVLETREEHNDVADRRIIAGAKRARRASPALAYEFGHRDTEPLLWPPDAVAGMVASARVDGSTDPLDALGGTLAIHEVCYR